MLKDGKNPESTNSDDWEQYSTDVHFTNRSDVAAANKQVVYIHDSTVIRLIYDCANSYSQYNMSHLCAWAGDMNSLDLWKNVPG